MRPRKEWCFTPSNVVLRENDILAYRDDDDGHLHSLIVIKDQPSARLVLDMILLSPEKYELVLGDRLVK